MFCDPSTSSQPYIELETMNPNVDPRDTLTRPSAKTFLRTMPLESHLRLLFIPGCNLAASAIWVIHGLGSKSEGFRV